MNGVNEMLTTVVIMLLTLMLIGLIMKKFNQPYFSAYILAGIILGPCCLGVFTKPDTIGGIGELGLLIEMFFIGMHLEIRKIIRNIRKPLLGVFTQLLFSFTFIFIIGSLYSWPIRDIILFSFIISLSSSSIILEYLDKNKERDTPLGMLTTTFLVLQDFLPVPMLLAINFMGSSRFSLFSFLQVVTATIIIILLIQEVVLRKKIKLPVPEGLQNDHELQIFLGLLLCFGSAWLTQFVQLSASIGALVAGLIISHTTGLRWLGTHLMPFRIFCLSLFFLSIGLQINLHFIAGNAGLISLLVAIIMIINSIINASVFRLLGESMRNSLYAGALLSQIGEFSLVLCIVARNEKIVGDNWYQLTLSVISLTILVSAIWINVIRKYIYKVSIVPIFRKKKLARKFH